MISLKRQMTKLEFVTLVARGINDWSDMPTSKTQAMDMARELRPVRPLSHCPLADVLYRHISEKFEKEFFVDYVAIDIETGHPSSERPTPAEFEMLEIFGRAENETTKFVSSNWPG